ncbi:MAG TPA: hypothetical protein VHB54_08370 [Mucilaginibacter sp.]|nr:hypothetical protein [Bacteroidota bacterium]HVS90884.1 hypothetical protein [Mucilaginibacter sp.]HVW13821.1 hypothetical protein [Mucilaginibacter sp.]
MEIVYMALKVSALLATVLLPLLGPHKLQKRNNIELSDWAVNDKGRLINLAESEPNSHPIRIKH